VRAKGGPRPLIASISYYNTAGLWLDWLKWAIGRFRRWCLDHALHIEGRLHADSVAATENTGGPALGLRFPRCD